MTYTIDETFPHPKANNLHKIAAVVDVVHAGANTGAAVAEALDIEEREGSYYADAAGYLGLLETVVGEPVKTYSLTTQGTTLMLSDYAERAIMMLRLVGQTPGVQVFAEDGHDGVMSMLDYAGLAEATALRRAGTISSWFNQIANEDDMVAGVTVESTGAQGRALEAAKRAEEVRRARVAVMAPRERTFGTCSSCFMSLPATGKCDDCD